MMAAPGSTHRFLSVRLNCSSVLRSSNCPCAATPSVRLRAKTALTAPMIDAGSRSSMTGPKPPPRQNQPIKPSAVAMTGLPNR